MTSAQREQQNESNISDQKMGNKVLRLWRKDDSNYKWMVLPYLPQNGVFMKAILVIEYESSVKELVGILIQNGYKVTVTKIGYWWEHKYQVEVRKDESNTCN